MRDQSRPPDGCPLSLSGRIPEPGQYAAPPECRAQAPWCSGGLPVVGLTHVEAKRGRPWRACRRGIWPRRPEAHHRPAAHRDHPCAGDHVPALQGDPPGRKKPKRFAFDGTHTRVTKIDARAGFQNLVPTGGSREAFGKNKPAVFAAFLATQFPLGRLGRPEEVADDVVAYRPRCLVWG
jgi:hypothetical protein